VWDYLSPLDPDWSLTQTLPPGGLGGGPSGEQSVKLEWQPIDYIKDGGYYLVYQADTPEGPYIQVGETLTKTETTYVVDALNRGQTYYFSVQSFTPAHKDQQNDLYSELSEPVAAMPLILNMLPLMVRQ
jgi:YHS domain-containing protein